MSRARGSQHRVRSHICLWSLQSHHSSDKVPELLIWVDKGAPTQMMGELLPHVSNEHIWGEWDKELEEKIFRDDNSQT